MMQHVKLLPMKIRWGLSSGNKAMVVGGGGGGTGLIVSFPVDTTLHTGSCHSVLNNTLY